MADTEGSAPLEIVKTIRYDIGPAHGRLTVVDASTALLAGGYGVAVLECAAATLKPPR